MALKVYNTLNRELQVFVPIEENRVGMYVCGPTVYNYAHIGNLRSFIFEDIVRRTFEYFDFDVKHVMNITDVGHLTDDADQGEDKMIKSAQEKEKSVWEIAEFFTEAFFADIDQLNIKRPHVTCRATQHIQDMINLIQRIEKNGFTYFAGGNLYFDISKFRDYGKLALLTPGALRPGSRTEIDENKKNPADFVLWFTRSKFDHQAMLWDSPWGIGYPGWHIECSAMSMKHLGSHFDIHCGAIDLIPVHHTNEIAQSQAATGEKWVNYWLHGEFLVLSDKKMAKSAGNFLTLASLIERGYHPLDYRYFCLNAHYRSQLHFSFQALDAARSGRQNLVERIVLLKDVVTDDEELSIEGKALSYLARFRENLTDDFNTPRCLGDLWGLIKDEDIDAASRLDCVYRMDRIFGLDLAESTVEKTEVNQESKKLIQEREAARARKDFKKADELRNLLKNRGIIIEDTPQGPRYRRDRG